VFSSIAGGRYNLDVTKPGYAMGGYGQLRPDGNRLPLDVVPGAPPAAIKLRLWQYGSISGTIVDDANEPVVGVTVRAMRSWPYIGRRRYLVEGSALTDDRGMYRIGSLLPGDYTAVVPAKQTSIPVDVYDSYWQNTTNAELRSAIFSATSAISPPGSAQARRIGDVVVIAGAQGAVQSDPAATGRLSIVPTTFYPGVTAPAQAGVIALASGENKAGVDVRLMPQPAVRVTGTVIGPEGPARLFPMRLVAKWSEEVAGETSSEVAGTLTDRQGVFTFFGVTAGQYVVQATQAPRFGGRPPMNAGSLEQTLWAFEPVTVGIQDARVNVTLRPGLRVSGRLAFDGAAPRPTAQRLQQVPVLIEPVEARPAVSPIG
jgi:hypothetical protein